MFNHHKFPLQIFVVISETGRHDFFISKEELTNWLASNSASKSLYVTEYGTYVLNGVKRWKKVSSYEEEDV